MLDIVMSSPNKEINSMLSKLNYLGSLKPIIFNPRSVADFKQLRKLPSAETLVIGTSQDEKLIRRILEDKLVDGFMNIEYLGGKEHTHYRRSNLNQVLAKIAADNGKTYFIDFSRILNAPSSNRYIVLGRIIQNIRILQKYKVPISIASFTKDPYGARSFSVLKSFAHVLGAAKVTLVETVFQKKTDRLSGRTPRKGVRVLN